MAFLIVLTGCLSLIAGSCIAWVGATFNHANLALVGGLVSWVEGMSHVPYGSMEIPPPALWQVWAWYAVLALLACRGCAAGTT